MAADLRPKSEREELDRAEHAKAVLDNPLVKEALQTLKDDVINAWEQTNMRDAEAREKAWMYYVTVKKFENLFLNFIATGKMAAIQLEEKRLFNIFRGK